MNVSAVLKCMISLVLTMMLLTGCSYSRTLVDGHLSYNEALRTASDQEILLNIVRLRYLDSLEFLSIASINSSVTLSVGLLAEARNGSLGTDTLATGTAGYSTTPTFTFVPQRGGSFAKRMIEPISIESLVFLSSTNRDIHEIFRLFVSQANSLQNQQGHVDAAFLDATKALTLLQMNGQATLGFRDVKKQVSPLMEADQVRARDVLQALNHNLIVDQHSDSGKVAFSRNVEVATLYIAKNADNRTDLIEQLSLDPHNTFFDVVAAAGMESVENTAKIRLRTRSLMHCLAFLSQGVEVPPEHMESGVASAGWPHPEVKSVPMADVFQIHSSRNRPDAASVAVQHRGTWFYLRDDDSITKNTFFLIAEAFRMALEHNSGHAPLLTIPVG